MKKILFLSIFLLLFLSCSKENLTDEQNSKEHANVKSDYGILSEDEACEIFNDYLGAFVTTRGVRTQTKVSSINKVYSSAYLGNMSTTRSGSGLQKDVPFYELTIDNDDNTTGFAVVVGDKRFPEVIAYCPFGSISDTTHIEGLATYFREMTSFITAEINRQEQTNRTANPITKAITPSTSGGYIDHWQPENLSFYTANYDTQIIYDYFYYEEGKTLPWWFDNTIWYSGSWLAESYNASIPHIWDQYSPYNNLTPIINGERAPIGCVALAMGTIMARHKRPSNYNWNAITSTASINPGNGTPQNAVSTMLHDVAVKIKTSWTQSGGSIFTEKDMVSSDVKEGFEALGYTCEISANKNEINADTIRNNMKRGLPVMLISNSNYDGHAFVVDGIMTRKRYMYSRGWANYDWINGTYDQVSLHYIWQTEMQSEQLHCLWGWRNGMGNGWYYRLQPIDVSIPIYFTGYNKALYTNIKPRT